ncbi:MAG TPA: choice-of-anchor D domain-containing protein [Solirubrobacterales bacterium]|jgi:hypothetical protein|nr:choice-of-anchor D domain-containing protein [Solirubrobacterales bacterium]
MSKTSATPRLFGTAVLFLLLTALALPAAVLAAPEEGSGTLTAAPDPIVLATTTVGNQSPAQAVTLGYEGEGEASINKVTIEGEESGEFFLNGSNCANLADGQHCEAHLGAKPNSSGEKQAYLVVTFNGERPVVSFPISVRSVAPELSLAPESYDFGLQRINRETTSTNLQLTNDGEAEVQLGGLEIAGPGQGAFSTGPSSCWGNWLAPGQSCSIQVGFDPHETGPYAAELRALANGSVFTATLSGEGGRANIETPENPLDFGAATAGSEGVVRTITLSNSGNLPAGFFIGVIAGGDAGSFRLLDENCTLAELAPAGTCSAHVRFAPRGPGPKTARLAFFGDGEDGMMVQLDGEGVLPAASIAPGGFDFGNQVSATRSPPHGFTIANQGTTRLDLDQVWIGGSERDQFVISSDDCGGASLLPGEECLVRVRFAPDGSGPRQATLQASGDGPTIVALLAGTATESAPSAASSSARAAITGGLPGPPPTGSHPWHGQRHRRFIRGGDIDTPRAQRTHRSR